VPVEPPPSRWALPTAGAFRGRDDLVGVGADLEPGTLLQAYRTGLFPMPVPGQQEMLWWSPYRRGILPLATLHVSRSLRRSRRRFEVRFDSAFADVVAGCADPRRTGGWIDADIAQAYLRLHRLGWAHSAEVWRDGVLAGGVYGVAIGGLFAGESMFSRETDASKVALVALVERLVAAGEPGRLFDVQWVTPHLQTLGAVAIPRREYLRRLAAALELPPPPWD
jgi:leucyl/phenylalanyl-tRNA--protein transferase